MRYTLNKILIEEDTFDVICKVQDDKFGKIFYITLEHIIKELIFEFNAKDVLCLLMLRKNFVDMMFILH